MLDHLVLGLTAALQFKHFVFMMLGTVIGLWVGVLPGLGGPVAMAILIPFTFSMDPLSALLMLASISVGAAFGGSVTSILLNIPGEASSAATAYDGYPMAQQGRAKVAARVDGRGDRRRAHPDVASAPVAKAALAFSPAEYFALAILGLTVVVGRRARLDAEGFGDGRARHRRQPDRTIPSSGRSATPSVSSTCSTASVSCR